MHNTPSDMLQYIRLRQCREGRFNEPGRNNKITLGSDAVDEDDLHGGQLLPALQKVLRNRKKTLVNEFSYSPDDLETLSVECGFRENFLSVSIDGNARKLRRSRDGGHDRHWHILFEIGMTQNVLQYNRLACARAREIALHPCPTPHPIASGDEWFLIKNRRSLGASFMADDGCLAAYAALSAMLGLPAPLAESLYTGPEVNDVATRNADLLSPLCAIVRREYPDYWLPEFGIVSINGAEGAAQAAGSIGKTPNADRLLVQALTGRRPVVCLRRDIEGAWWILNRGHALPARAGNLTMALTGCGFEDGARIAPFRAPLTVGSDGKIAKWGQLHAHYVMTRNLLNK